MGYPRFRRARTHKFLTKTSGTITANGTAWADLATTTLDLTLEAQVGDVIEYGMSGYWNNESVTGYLDVATVVSGSAVNYFRSAGSATSSGVLGWVGPSIVLMPFMGSVLYTVVSGDVSSGTVTLRPRVRTSTATNKTLRCTTDEPMDVYAKNLGPVDPN